MGKPGYEKESALSDYEDFDEEGEDEDFEEEEEIEPGSVRTGAKKRDLSGKEGRKKGGRNGR